MFTGIVESVGVVKKVINRENYLVMDVEHTLTPNDLKIGDSIACDGACLTIVKFHDNLMTYDISQETTARTIVGNYKAGSRVNLERAVKVGDRLGGHIVTGHVDTVATISNKRHIGESIELTIQYDGKFDKLVISKGSIAINGVSLTVNETSNSECIVNLIPHTLKNTNLNGLETGGKANLEFDMIGKYALKAANRESSSSLTFSKLAESGW